MAECAFGQRRPGVGALALIGAQLIADFQQHDFTVLDADFQAMVFGDIFDMGDAMQGHDRSPQRWCT
ncbi:hypothetical protein D3C71_2165820 [compost metagenome]